MISSVCQGLQSHVLSFQLFPQEPSHYSSRFSPDVHRKCEVEENSRHGESGGGWSFQLEALSNGNEEDKVYVHPLVKNSSTKLSKKSLEMCTESLGSESGSDMGDKENDISLLTLEADDSVPNVRCSTWMHKKLANIRRRDTSYPPPLTSISGSTGVRIRMESYREDGRLVLRAVATNSACRSSYFHAERSHGRLKIQLVKHMERRARENENGEVVEEEGEEVLGDDEEEGNWGTEENGGEEIGMEIFGRPRSGCSSSSCKQGGRQSKELLNWKPRWVST